MCGWFVKFFSQNNHSIKIDRDNLPIAFIQSTTYNYSEIMEEKKHIGRSHRKTILHYSTFFAG